jgi:diguanylate cyclase (GGDEF)-like protein
MLDTRKIWTSSQLPTLPAVAMKLLILSRDPDADITRIVELIKSDPALSAKILKATNSAYYAFSKRITSIDHAVPLLGTTVVFSLALSFSLVDVARNRSARTEAFVAYWTQSLVQAAASEALGRMRSEDGAADFFLAGLLIDLGRLAMLTTVPAEYQPVLEQSKAKRQWLHDAELELLGTTHVQIGAELMRRWNLPDELIRTIELHHAPVEELQAARGHEHYHLICASATAAAIGDYFRQDHKGLALTRLRELASALYSLDEDALTALLETIRSRSYEAADLCESQIQDLGEPGDLLAQANEQLALLTVRTSQQRAQVLEQHQSLERQKHELAMRCQELEGEVSRDTLTKLYNRRVFDTYLSRELSRASRQGRTMGIVFIDIDRFKGLNDTFGHAFGDEVLQHVARTIEGALRETDTLFRYGGEEFVVLVVEPTEAGLLKVAERIRAQVEREWIEHDGGRVPVTASVGAAIGLPARRDRDLGSRLVQAADDAMYESKREGRNRCSFRALIPEHERTRMQTIVRRRFSRWLVDRRYTELTVASRALLHCDFDRRPFGELARRHNLLTDEQIACVIREQESRNERFGDTAIRLGFLSEPQVVDLLAIQAEDPRQLAAALVSQGALTAERARAALDEYQQGLSLRPAAVESR